MTTKLEVTLTRSLIGIKPGQKATAEALGLRKMNQTVEHNDNVAVRGAIAKVAHLVTVTEK
ncbi:50S ribosomal protein L30 [Kurthia zopfii]|uniref:Large ribosomal subunit protein uL30 n=1 Tax=Kurthia zopfii TaxID=1650 RepID=A0A2U3ACA5_9BACL|nr:50S ribosomal protein L30 [Kurthia zopfii]PWI22176.1 50S ribosomal protein L30 [Kurthia zopfii]TDR37058.1 LSU ribosomal protein L30P [Kurthia zopfii]STX11118.1 50S ribosomal protein L30 [Kurthia zopfii]VEI05525.1 50S ribosomal protein L30 [Kurthia zopfii]GEK30770.1 50S ribosomal protein L30 [Kurthia zopfii]